MPDTREWLDVTLDSGSRHEIAEGLEARSRGDVPPELNRLLRMLRSRRDELLLDREQAQHVLDLLNRDKRLSSLRARLEAFLGLR
jgi:hypothetical protein